jgi:hypothetical protein
MQLAEYNYNKNLELWNKSWEREIAYNDPSAQMQRLQNAGINPHMAYAKGGVSNTASSGTLPQYSQESLQVAPGIGQRLGDKLGEIVGTVQQVANLSLTKQAVRKAEAEADLAKLTTERQAAMWKSEKGEYSEYADVYPQMVNGKVVQTYADTEYGRQRAIERAGKELTVQNLASDAGIKQLQQQGLLSNNEVAKYKAFLAKNKIDPEGGGWMGTLIREVQKIGVDAGISPRDLIVNIIKRLIN